MKRYLWFIPLLIAILLTVFLVGQPVQLAAAQTPDNTATPPAPDASVEEPMPSPTTSVDPELEASLAAVLQARANAKSPEPGPYNGFGIAIDNVFYSADGETALLWLGLIDPVDQQLLAAEPALAIARRSSDSKAPIPWSFTFNSEAGFEEQLQALPAEIQTESIQERMDPGVESKAYSLPLRGYKLPWAAGLGKRLSGSIGHFLIYNSCTETTCRYAYDFADGTMFPLLAAKGGIVKYFYDSCNNGDTNCTNSIALEDRSTDPATYQIYIHLAKGSIPAELKQLGVPVQQGQYIGNTDDTGYSSGHHLHFHVAGAYRTYLDNGGHTVPWGNSIDIRFADVNINDGTPRTCYEASAFASYGTGCISSPVKDTFVSGNVGADPPDGRMDQPAPNTSFTNPTVRVTGSAWDRQGVTRVQAIVLVNGVWKEVGAPLMLSGGNFSGEFSLCEAGVASGPFQMALRIWDLEGNQTLNFPGQRTLVNNASCRFEAAINSPAMGAANTASSLSVSGFAASDIGIKSVVLYARQSGAWKTYPVTLSGETFTQSVSVCSAGFDIGPVMLGLKVTDKAGNVLPGLVGQRMIINNYRCSTTPAPRCVPNSDQVSVYSDPNFEGVCRVLDVGNYASGSAFSPVLGDDIESLRVGSGVHLITFDGDNFSGRTEAFEPSDANLADNRIGANAISSIKVQQMSTNHSIFPPPTTSVPVNPSTSLGRAPTSVDSLVLTWTGGESATQFSGRLTRLDDGTYRTMAWNRGNSFSVGNLTPGRYSWWVQGVHYLANATYEQRSGISTVEFTVADASLPNPPSLPSNTPNLVNNTWTGSGQWHWGSLPEEGQGWLFNNGSDYNSGARAGDLTSPVIQVPGGSSYLTFDYLRETESNRLFWDQRRVQISVSGAAFVDVAQLNADAAGAWLTSEPIDLTPYAGKPVRVRLHFDTLDGTANGYAGWLVRAAKITTGAVPQPCSESPANNTLATASDLAINTSASRLICPAGDVDYFRFSSTTGTRLSIDIDATRIGSPLDPAFSLYDDQGNLLLENDDILLGDVRDSHLSFTLPDTRSYYLRVQAWDHPSAGGTTYGYTLRASTDTTAPSGSLISPVGMISSNPMEVVVDASDSANAYLRVDFYGHSGNWDTDEWRLLGSDPKPEDGWTFNFDRALYPNVAALYAEAVDGAGNRTGLGVLTAETKLYLPLTQK